MPEGARILASLFVEISFALSPGAIRQSGAPVAHLQRALRLQIIHAREHV